MIGDRRVWWGAAAVVVGVGAALLAGAGVAAAASGNSSNIRSGSSQEHSGSSQKSNPSAGAKSANPGAVSTGNATAKRRPTLAGTAPGARASRIKATRNPHQATSAADGTVDSASIKPKTVDKALRSRLTTVVARMVSTIHAADNGAAEPVRLQNSVTPPVANATSASRPLPNLVLNLLSSAGSTRKMAAVAAFPKLAAWSAPAAAGVTPALATLSDPSTNGVTGVRVGHSDLTIPYGANGYTTAADWYFPTQEDGSVQADGVIWLQHGFLGRKSWYSALATQLARQTNSVVVVPNISSFAIPLVGCSGCTLNSVPLQEATATMFLGDRAALNISANAAGFSGTLPKQFILTGHSAGGGFAAAVAGFTVDNGAATDLLGVVMFDGVSSNGTFGPAVAKLDDAGIPIYQIAAPPQPWNADGQTTNELVTLNSGQFTGVVLNNGSHVDSLIGGVPIIDFVAQLLIRRSPPGNTEAVYTFASGWINDMYAGNSPSNPQYGLYGNPGQPIILGPAAAIVLGVPAVMDVNSYLADWSEVASLKKFAPDFLVKT